MISIIAKLQEADPEGLGSRTEVTRDFGELRGPKFVN